jgi:chromosome segregation ATPase
MLKKLVIAAAAVVVGLVILKKTDLGSLVQVWWGDLVSCAKRQVSPETRIKQLEMEVAKIDADRAAAVNKLSQREFAHLQLKEEIDALRTRQEQVKKDLAVLIEALESDNTRVSFKGQSFSAEGAQAELEALQETYKAGKDNLKVKEQLLKAKGDQLELAVRGIRKLNAEKEKLVLEVEKFKAQLELLRRKQMDNRIEIDDTQLSKCKALRDNLKKILVEEEIRDKNNALYLAPEVPAPVKEEQQRTKAAVLKAAKAALAEGDKAGGEQ